MAKFAEYLASSPYQLSQSDAQDVARALVIDQVKSLKSSNVELINKITGELLV